MSDLLGPSGHHLSEAWTVLVTGAVPTGREALSQAIARVAARDNRAVAAFIRCHPQRPLQWVDGQGWVCTTCQAYGRRGRLRYACLVDERRWLRHDQTTPDAVHVGWSEYVEVGQPHIECADCGTWYVIPDNVDVA